MFRLVGRGRLVGRCDAFEAYDELVEWTKEGRLLLDQREYAAGVSREDSSCSGAVSKRSEWQCEDSGRSSSGNKSSMVRFEKANDVVCGTVGDICGRMSGRCRSKYAADEGDKGGDCGIRVGEGFASSILRHLSFKQIRGVGLMFRSSTYASEQYRLEPGETICFSQVVLGRISVCFQY